MYVLNDIHRAKLASHLRLPISDLRADTTNRVNLPCVASAKRGRKSPIVNFGTAIASPSLPPTQPVAPNSSPASRIGPYSNLFPPILTIRPQKNSQFFFASFYRKPLVNQAKKAQKHLPNYEKNRRFLNHFHSCNPTTHSRSVLTKNLQPNTIPQIQS